jgi:hypothetical protein
VRFQSVARLCGGGDAFDDLGGHPKPAIRGHLKSGQRGEEILGWLPESRRVVEKTAAMAALEIAKRFPLSHNPCYWHYLAVRDDI